MKLDKVSAGYGQKVIVRDVTIDIQKGEVICLIGPNGGGKSTLLKSINGSLAIKGGSIFLGEKDLSLLSVKEIARTMSIVTTERIRPQLMTCRDVVMTGRLPFTGGFGKYSSKDMERTKRALKCMKIDDLADSLYDSLSDGQKQRTLIARAVCQEPQVLVMDEPTSYMDIRHRLELLDVVRQMAMEEITVIMSLHEIELALDVADRLILVYDDGHVLVRSPKEVLDNSMIKDLYGLDDKMYAKIEGTLTLWNK